MMEITVCIGDIGHAYSTIFSTLDLTSLFWQMQLDEESQLLPAFTIPGKVQYHWVTSPMCLLRCPASFQLLMKQCSETKIMSLFTLMTSYYTQLHMRNI